MSNPLRTIVLLYAASLAACSPNLETSRPVIPQNPLKCALPAESWEALDPAVLGFDPVKLQAALDWGLMHVSGSVAVYRHGCLAGQSTLDTVTATHAFDGWSMTKSVTSMVVGRAVTLGLFDINKPIGTWVPEADVEHARLTPRQLLSMTSGLHSNYVRDFALPLPDRVCDALALPFDHSPGTNWQYAQTTLDLLIWALERALDRDVQEFAQAELFGPVGIEAGNWTWERDPHGHTNAWAHLNMRNADWARLGQLMLQNGNWNGRQLLSTDYIRQALSRVPQNPAYGLLFWLNGGPWWQVPDVEGPDSGTGSLIPTGPDDLFAMVGLGEQRTYIIPSRGLVIVRLGERGSHDPDTRVLLWSGRAGEIDWELPRRVLLAVTDVPYEDPGPYESAGAHVPPVSEGIYGDALDLAEHAEAMSTPPCH
jgi:CubicO group peptidase (beta-lactamase class C family)